MNRKIRRGTVAAVAAVVASIAWATHVPPPNLIVAYTGTLPFDRNADGSINSAGQDGYDFYCINVTSGQQVSIGASSGNGLFPNLALYSTVAASGAAFSTIAGSKVSEVDNSAAANATLTFTPTTSGIYTVSVSTFTGQSGTYSIGGGGFTPAPASCPGPVTPQPVAANIPVPATSGLMLGGMAIALIGIAAFLRRKSRG